jgi:hypothetical protein
VTRKNSIAGPGLDTTLQKKESLSILRPNNPIFEK